jgi:hypothetical protein
MFTNTTEVEEDYEGGKKEKNINIKKTSNI